MTHITLTATTSTLFMPLQNKTTKEVARSKAATPLLRWWPTAATFAVAMNRVVVVAVNTIFILLLRKTGRTVGRTDSRLDGRPSGVGPDRLLANGCNICHSLTCSKYQQ